MKSQHALTDRLKKESTADKTKSDESQKKLHKEIQLLKETIEKIKGESTLNGNQNIQKLQVSQYTRSIRTIRGRK